MSVIEDMLTGLPRGTPIQEFYRDCSVLVTGGTGFMGKTLIEKLLRSCPSLKQVYIIIRSKKGKDVDTRVEEIFEDLVQSNLVPRLWHGQRWNRSEATLFLVSGTDSAGTGPEQPCSSSLARTALEQVRSNLVPLYSGDIWSSRTLERQWMLSVLVRALISGVHYAVPYPTVGMARSVVIADAPDDHVGAGLRPTEKPTPPDRGYGFPRKGGLTRSGDRGSGRGAEPRGSSEGTALHLLQHRCLCDRPIPASHRATGWCLCNPNNTGLDLQLPPPPDAHVTWLRSSLTCRVS
uniref:Fatty acyl-CoA reductase n=1 Tax=Timema shepardi TaxID=629360 RepID=A0A7R9ARL4_TIMSH|nr:unnamed protein product [Timema shepardi]